MIMKRSVVLMGAIMMMSSVIFAQTKQRHHRQGEGQGEKLKSELALNEEQDASIKGIKKKYGEQLHTLRKDSTLSRDQKHKTVQTLRGEKEKEISAVLTPDQKTKYEKFKAARVEKRNEQMKVRGEKNFVEMAKALSLTDDQTAKLKDANKSFAEKVKALRAQPGSDKTTSKEAFEKLRKEHKSAVQSILTTDQFSKWTTMRKTMKAKHKHGKK
jgi:hypothetical protein